MNRKYLMAIALCCTAFAPSWAEGRGGTIDAVLQQIESNNRDLQANAQLIRSQKLSNRADNNLPDPTLSYAHLWDSKDSKQTVGELVVSQSFDFPTQYATRSKMNRLNAGAMDAQAIAFRQGILLQAKELCLDIILLQRRHALLGERLKNAEELSALYTKRLQTGDANVLESNKINLELLNARTELRTNTTALNNALSQLIALNGNRPLTGDAQSVSTLTQTLDTPLPADFQQASDELLGIDPTLQSFHSQSAAARKQISLSRQGWLPQLEVGYRRNTETGHPLNGMVVGFSFPIFQNRNKVKMAKAQSLGIDLQHQNATVMAATQLRQLYDEASSLHASIAEYRRTFHQQQDLSLLKQALTGGQISMIEYFVEVSVLFQTQTNLLDLENQYEKAMAKMYKSKL